MTYEDVCNEMGLTFLLDIHSNQNIYNYLI